MDTNRLPKQALQYKPKGRRNIGRPRKRWRDQLHLEDQGTGSTPNHSGTWWWWWWGGWRYNSDNQMKNYGPSTSIFGRKLSFVLKNMRVSVLGPGFTMHDIGSMRCGTTATLPVTLLTTRFNIQEFYMAILSSLVVLYGSQNKQNVFPHTTLTVWFL